MKWFQTDSDTPNDPKIKAILRRGLPNPNGGQAAAGALLLLWCYIADHGDGVPGLGVNSQGAALPLDEMADECLFDSEADLRQFLDFLADKRHIDPDSWKAGIVRLPAMEKRADAYARSKGRGGQDGGKRAKPGEKSPESAPTNKPTTPVQDQQDQGQLALAPPAAAGPGPDDLVATWNKHRKPGPLVQQLTDERRRAYAKALKVQPDLTVWGKAIDYINGQAWANAPGTGEHPNWRMDLDYLARPGKLQRAIENMATDGGARRPAAGTGRAAPTAGKYRGLSDDDPAGS